MSYGGMQDGSVCVQSGSYFPISVTSVLAGLGWALGPPSCRSWQLQILPLLRRGRQGSNIISTLTAIPLLPLLVFCLDKGLCVVRPKEKSHTWEYAERGKNWAAQAASSASVPVSGQTEASCSELSHAAARSRSQWQAPHFQQLPAALVWPVQVLCSKLACT